MSVEATMHVWGSDAASPLAKLILIKFADNGDGVGQIDPDKYVRFCMCSHDELADAVATLVDDGYIEFDGVSTYRLAGYVPHYERAPLPPVGFQKKPISKSVRLRVFERDGFQCVKCGIRDSLTVDHIHPESKGGTLDMVNLQTLCRPCNSRKGDRICG